MKKLLLFLFPVTLFAQTHYTQDDISALAAHQEQWLLTNTTNDQIDYSYGVSKMVQSFIYSKTKWKAKYSECGTKCIQWVHQNTTPGSQKKRHISYKLYYDHLPGGERISKKVVFEGSKDLIIDFFMSYWTEDFEYPSDQKSEYSIASSRFLSDIATLNIDDKGNASIVVTTYSESFTSKISFN